MQTHGSSAGELIVPVLDPSVVCVAGVEVTYYATTSFMHAKYMQVDGKKASVSAVNWSRNSFMNNREVCKLRTLTGRCLFSFAHVSIKAGMIVSSGDASDSAAPLLEFLTSVFEDDLRLGIPYTNPPSFSDTDLEIINNIAVRPVSLPSPPSKRAFVSPVPEPVTSDMEVVFALACIVASLTLPAPLPTRCEQSLSVCVQVAFTSPDYALTTLEADVSKATSTLEIYTYQINNDGNGCMVLLRPVESSKRCEFLVA